jgi:hypothetical protein
MADVTFRDFAGAVMANDSAKAGTVLAELLNLDAAQANAAAAFFFQNMMAGGPAFMGKAMGLRAAVESGSEDGIRSLLAECFDLRGDQATAAIAKLTQR